MRTAAIIGLFLTMTSTSRGIEQSRLDTFATGLRTVAEARPKVADIHPLLQTLYPVAVAEDDSLFIFEADSSGARYAFVTAAPAGMPLPHVLRAAFPLDCLGGRTACVVSPDVFPDPAGTATIFHEFAHCYQGETCERRLKDSLAVARKAMSENDQMWELNYPFPYAGKKIRPWLSLFEKAVHIGDLDGVEADKSRLRTALSREAYEYLAWQMWKEGFARLVENRVRQRLGLAAIEPAGRKRYDRVLFYGIGARYIELLTARDPRLWTDLEALFKIMLDARATR